MAYKFILLQFGRSACVFLKLRFILFFAVLYPFYGFSNIFHFYYYFVSPWKRNLFLFFRVVSSYFYWRASHFHSGFCWPLYKLSTFLLLFFIFYFFCFLLPNVSSSYIHTWNLSIGIQLHAHISSGTHIHTHLQ